MDGLDHQVLKVWTVIEVGKDLRVNRGLEAAMVYQVVKALLVDQVQYHCQSSLCLLPIDKTGEI